MKQLYTFVLVCFLSTSLTSQNFSDRQVLIDNLPIELGEGNRADVNELVYCRLMNDKVHFISQNSEIVSMIGGVNWYEPVLDLYKYENETLTHYDSIGRLEGFVVDVFDHNGDGFTDILGHFQIKLATSATTFGSNSDPVEEVMGEERVRGRFHRARDFNGDGIADLLTLEPLVVSLESRDNVNIYLLDSNNEFEEPISFFNDVEVLAVDVFDFNKDGNPDVAYIRADGELVVKTNSGSGGWFSSTVASPDAGSFIVAEDFDSDDDLDIMITGANNKDLHIVTNNFSLYNTNVKVLDTETLYGINTGDFNADGNADLAYLEEIGNSLKVMVAMGLGDDNFETPIEVGSVQFNGINYTAFNIGRSYSQALDEWLTVFDYDLDGDEDLLMNDIIEQQYIVYENLFGEIVDNDNDGFPNDVDCDDNNASVNPGQMEIPYNGLDDDCDPATLDDDLDQDGFPLGPDCNDGNPNINPDQPEIPYNGIDDDCNQATLDDDLDQDGYPNADDCDDNNANINPGANEIAYNGIDDDCDEATLDDDLDQDGYPNADDCDDNNANVNPGQTEIAYNGIDDDCDEATLDDDLDQDGYPNADDCDDTNANINPGATETVYNGIDDDCDPTTLDDDLDQDGYPLAEDCNDENASINPGITETPYNGIDDDCDAATLDDDLDQDGFPLDEDCDDDNAAINPNAIEIPGNGIDEDCDGLDDPSAVHDLSNTRINIYPNPVIDKIYIVVEGPLDYAASLFDLSGKLVTTAFNENSLNVSTIAQGTYMLEIKDLKTGKTVIEKIIIGKS